MGKKAEAVEWLGRAALKGDPAFEAFMAKLEEQWEHYRASL
jgi:hypothetical protein